MLKFLKYTLILAAVALFIFACSKNAPTGENTNGTTANSQIIVPVSPTATLNSNTTQPVSTELASAQKIYEEKCIKCHKSDGTGGVTDIEGTKIKAPNFGSDRMKNDKDSDWIDTIENGAKEDGMPAFKGKLSGDEIKNLVKYIHQNFQGK